MTTRIAGQVPELPAQDPTNITPIDDSDVKQVSEAIADNFSPDVNEPQFGNNIQERMKHSQARKAQEKAKEQK